MATTVYTDLDHKGNKLLNVDLTQVATNMFPSGIGGTPGGITDIMAGYGILVTDNGDGTITVSAAPPAQLKVEAFNQRFSVADPLAQAPLRVQHYFGTTLVAVTVLEVGTPSVPIKAQVSVVDVNTVEVLLTGETAGEFDVFVIAGLVPGTP